MEATQGTFGNGIHRVVYQFHPGKTGQTPVVLVHGLSGSQRWWQKNVPSLETERPVYVVDLVGYGTNWRLMPAGLKDSADAIAEFIALLPSGRAHLIGHSMGGQIAATLAATHPERVHRLVLAAASGLLRSHLAAMALKLPVAAHYSPLDFLPTLAADALRAGPLNLLLSTRNLLADDITALLPQIQAQTLLIWGTRDNLVPLSTGQTMSRRIPRARLEIIEGAGHVLMWDHAETFNRLIHEFLQGDTG